MERKEFVGKIIQALGEMDVKYPDGYGYEELAEHLVNRMEDAGVKPPCVDGDKCQFLLSKYIDPSFNHWDEDFDFKLGKEYKEWLERRQLYARLPLSERLKRLSK